MNTTKRFYHIGREVFDRQKSQNGQRLCVARSRNAAEAIEQAMNHREDTFGSADFRKLRGMVKRLKKQVKEQG